MSLKLRGWWLGALCFALGGVQAQTVDGAALYAQNCAACHQAQGGGTPGLAPAVKGSHWAKLGAEPRYLATLVLNGLSGPIMVDGQRFVGAMPGFAGSLSDTELAAVLDHVVKLQDRQAPAYDPATLATWRAKGGNPGATRVLREQLMR